MAYFKYEIRGKSRCMQENGKTQRQNPAALGLHPYLTLQEFFLVEYFIGDWCPGIVEFLA